MSLYNAIDIVTLISYMGGWFCIEDTITAIGPFSHFNPLHGCLNIVVSNSMRILLT